MEDSLGLRDAIAATWFGAALPDRAATDRLEALVRCYAPCIWCATHVHDVDVQRLPADAVLRGDGDPGGVHSAPCDPG